MSCLKRSPDPVRTYLNIPCNLDGIPREFVKTDVKKHEFWFDDQTSIRLTVVTHPPSHLPGRFAHCDQEGEESEE